MNEGKDQRRWAFSIGDGMILVAAVALSFASVRGWVELRASFNQFDNGPLAPRLLYVHDWALACRLWLLMFTFAIVPLGLLRPRPLEGPNWGRPVMVVPLAVGLSMLMSLLDDSSFPRLIGLDYNYESKSQRIFYLWSHTVSIDRGAMAVGIAWLTLALCGGWRREASWVGWLGRLLGVCWIVGFLGFRAYEAIMYLRYGSLVV